MQLEKKPFLLILLAFILLFQLAGCDTNDSQEPEDGVVSDVENTAEEPQETTIRIDGYGGDWEGRKLTRADKAEDAEEGFLDITSGFAFFTHDALYIYLDLLHPAHDYTQIDFELRPDGEPMLISWKPGEGEPGGLEGSWVAVAEGIEARFDLAALGSPEDIQIAEIRIMAGACCDYPEWRPVDIWEPGKIAFVNEVDGAAVAMGSETDSSTMDNGADTTGSNISETSINAGKDFLVDEPLTERPHYVWLEQKGEYADYLFRDVSQNAQEAEWGPDGYLYVADGSGKHIFKVAPDGTIIDLEIWKTHRYMQEYGPNALAFDLDGNLLFNTGPYVYRYNVDASIDYLFFTPEGAVRSLAMDESGVLYYSLNTGYIYRWNPDSGDELMAFYYDPQFCIGPDRKMYISVYGGGNIVTVDLETKESNMFIEGYWTHGAMYCRFDAEGDLWVRGTDVFNQFDRNGEEIPVTIDGSPSENFRKGLGGDIVFDDQGNLWFTSASGDFLKLTPVAGNENDFITTFRHDSFDAANVAVSPDGTVYAMDLYPGEIWAFSPDGSYEIIWAHGDQGRVGIAAAEDGVIYVGSIFGEIYKIENGQTSHYAYVEHANRLLIADDGNLYVVANGHGETEPSKILRVSAMDQVEEFLTGLGGVEFDDRAPQITKNENGLYVLNQKNGTFYAVDYEGNSESLIQIASDVNFSVITSSPTTGKIYFFADDSYTEWADIDDHVLYEYLPGGEPIVVSPVVPGDPAGMDVSFDGKWLYIVEVGAVDKIHIEP